ncbi:MAG: Gfo/Idh/MocA family oxidoreductase [Infirmifilum sp.]
MAEPLKIGVLGLGNIGKIHARNIKYKIKNAELVLLCDEKKDVVDPIATELNIKKIYYNCKDAIWDKDADAFVIALPTHLKKDIILEASKAGKHLFIEKPIALDLDQARIIIDAINRSGIKALVGYQRRYDRAFIKARELITGGKLGRIQYIRSWTRDPPWQPSGWAADPKTSGGRPIDSSSHDIDIIRYLTNLEIVEVYAEGSNIIYDIFKRTGDYDHIIVSLRLSNDAIGIIEYIGYTVYGYDVGVEVIGTAGRLSISMGTNSPISYSIGKSYEYDNPMNYGERFSDAYLNELINFINMIKYGEKPLITLEDAYKALQISLAIWKSLRERRPVEIQ